jgi:addiction module HigA family antidote
MLCVVSYRRDQEFADRTLNISSVVNPSEVVTGDSAGVLAKLRMLDAAGSLTTFGFRRESTGAAQGSRTSTASKSERPVADLLPVAFGRAYFTLDRGLPPVRGLGRPRNWLIHPGEILLEEFLVPMGISQYRLAKDISVLPAIHDRARTRAVLAHGSQLARYFGMSERFWLNLQAQYGLDVQRDHLGPGSRSR